MFLKIENQLFNVDNLQYYEYSENLLELFFNGNLSTKIKQNEQEYADFLELLNDSENIISLKETLGFNINLINGIYKKEDLIIICFVDSTSKSIENLDFNFVENKIIGE